MPISGLVVTTAGDDLPGALHENPVFEIGSPTGKKWPLVLDTLDRDQDRLQWEWINSLPGIERVDVVFVSFEGD